VATATEYSTSPAGYIAGDIAGYKYSRMYVSDCYDMDDSTIGSTAVIT
jgi:hypothetical protein